MEAKSLAGYHKKKEGGTFQSTIRSSTSFVTAMSTAMTPSLDGSRTCMLGGRLPPAPLDAGALHAPAEQP